MELRLNEALLWWRRFAGVYASGVLSSRSPPIWMDVLPMLAYDTSDRRRTLESLRDLAKAFAALFQAAACPTVAVGLATSVIKNLEASLEAAAAPAALPDGVVQDLLAPRLAELQRFETLLFKLFRDPRDEEDSASNCQKLPLFIRHVFGLAQVFFWGEQQRTQLIHAVEDLADTTAMLGLDVVRQAKDFDAIFPAMQGQVKLVTSKRARDAEAPSVLAAEPRSVVLIVQKLLDLSAKYHGMLSAPQAGVPKIRGASPWAGDEASVGAPQRVAGVEGRGTKRARSSPENAADAADAAEVPA